MAYTGGVPWPWEAAAAAAAVSSRSAAPEHGGSATDSTLYCIKSLGAYMLANMFVTCVTHCECRVASWIYISVGCYNQYLCFVIGSR